MDKELIERLAREAGYDTDDGQITMPHHHADGPADERSHLERFAALVAEECAKVCYAVAHKHESFAQDNLRAFHSTDGESGRSAFEAGSDIREKFCAKG